MHVTERTLTFGEVTYNLANELSVELTVPKLFFGQRRDDNVNNSLAASKRARMNASMVEGELDEFKGSSGDNNNDNDDEESEELEDEWHRSNNWVT